MKKLFILLFLPVLAWAESGPGGGHPLMIPLRSAVKVAQILIEKPECIKTFGEQRCFLMSQRFQLAPEKGLLTQATGKLYVNNKRVGGKVLIRGSLTSPILVDPEFIVGNKQTDFLSLIEFVTHEVYWATDVTGDQVNEEVSDPLIKGYIAEQNRKGEIQKAISAPPPIRKNHNSAASSAASMQILREQAALRQAEYNMAKALKETTQYRCELPENINRICIAAVVQAARQGIIKPLSSAKEVVIGPYREQKYFSAGGRWYPPENYAGVVQLTKNTEMIVDVHPGGEALLIGVKLNSDLASELPEALVQTAAYFQVDAKNINNAALPKLMKILSEPLADTLKGVTK